MAKRRRIQGLLELPVSLVVESEVLGIGLSSRIADHAVRLTFPVAFPVVGGEGLAAGPGLPDELARLPSKWGALRSKNTETGEATYNVSTVRISFLTSEDYGQFLSWSAEFDSIADAYPAWWDIARSWLSAWLEMPSQLPDWSHQSLMYVVGPKGGVAPSGVMGTPFILDAPAISVAQIKGAFARASRQERLPLAQDLLLASRNALWAKDYRLAAIEAGSAAEVALATAIRGRLSRRVEPAYIKAAIEDANGVIGLYDQYLALLGPLPESKGAVMNKLAAVRNRAAHAGERPTKDDAIGALRVSGSLVNATHPLDLP
jgi:hypothetical protein